MSHFLFSGGFKIIELQNVPKENLTIQLSSEDTENVTVFYLEIRDKKSNQILLRKKAESIEPLLKILSEIGV